MKNSNRILRLCCVAALVIPAGLGIASTTENTTQITGEVITIKPEAPSDATDTKTASTDTPVHEPVDLSTATLTISYETVDSEDNTERVKLFEGSYQEDFSHEISTVEPIEVKIALQINEESNPMTINAVIGTSDIHLAFIDRPGPRDEFLLVGSSNQVMSPKNSFSVSGDLRFLDINLSNTTSVEVYATVLDEEGNLKAKRWGPVLVQNNSFSIEGNVDSPLMARLIVDDGSEFYINSEIILEPHGDIVVSQLGNQTEELSVVSGIGYHAMIVESWQQTDDYIALVEDYAVEYEQFRKRREAGEPEPEASDEDSDEEKNEAKTQESSESEDHVAGATAAEGCEDAVAQASNNTQSSQSPPKYWSLMQKKESFRNKVLREIAERDEDPVARYLAINMRPYERNDFASLITALRPLSKEFDEDFVAAFITPKIESYEQQLVVVQNDAALIPGQKVPEFTLANYDGQEVKLYDLLGEHDMVLIDFWASWCGPCIADFPELKKLHAAYTDEDFEIVGVSIDSTMEAWKGGVDDHELPWINLGEIQGWFGPVSTLYGVNSIPRGFLVDSQGCIYQKRVRPAALKEFLVDRYGLDDSLVEPEEEKRRHT